MKDSWIVNQNFVRQLAAKYWRPFVSLMAVVPVILNAFRFLHVPGVDLPGSGATPQSRFLIVVGSLVFITVRFPRVAYLITLLILGRPQPKSPEILIFRGPRPYGPGDTLPGRDAEAEAVGQLLRVGSFFILEGESGCGKSSLLNSIILPKLGERFSVCECRVADDPFGKLYSALRPGADRPGLVGPDQILESIRKKGPKPDSEGKKTSRQRNNNVLVCVDQFEELFVSVRDETRVSFLNTLRSAITDAGLHIVISIRSDFRDLLDKACREADPSQEQFDLGNYYELRAFTREQAISVLLEMLHPIYEGDPLLRKQIDHFCEELVTELLRPPRDKRISQQDKATVLPVELQTVGTVLEGIGMRAFSVGGLRRLGGKSGLLRAYVEDAKGYVWHKTGIPGSQSLLILRQLVSPAQTKWGRSARSVSETLNMNLDLAKRVLDGFADKYLVKKLPVIEGPLQSTSNGPQYELMHEHLVQILAEAPDPVLQRARDAEERLGFWRERTKIVLSLARNDKGSLLSRIRRLFLMPIPLVETLRLWRFAFLSQDRNMLIQNLRGFGFRSAVLTIPILGWVAWSYTDVYQIRATRLTAPVSQAVVSDQESVVRWTEALFRSGYTKDALNVPNQLGRPSDRALIFAVSARELRRLKKADDASQALEKAIREAPHITSYDDYLKTGLVILVGELLLTGRENEIVKEQAEWRGLNVPFVWSIEDYIPIVGELTDEGKIKDATEAVSLSVPRGSTFRVLAGSEGDLLSVIVTHLAASRRVDDAISFARAHFESPEAADSLTSAAQSLLELGDASASNRLVQAAYEIEYKTSPPVVALSGARGARSIVNTTSLMIALGRTGQTGQMLEDALAIARRDIDPDNPWPTASTIAEIAGVLAQLGQFERAMYVAAKVKQIPVSDDRQDYYSEALVRVSQGLSTNHQTDKALSLLSQIKSSHLQDTCLATAGLLLAKSRQPQESLLKLNLISDPAYKAHALGLAGIALAEVGYKSEAEDILNQAVESARSNGDVHKRSPTLSFLAAAFAKMHLFRKARLTANLCYYSQDKLNAYSEILLQYAYLKNRVLASTSAKWKSIDVFHKYAPYNDPVNEAEAEDSDGR